MRDKFRVFLAIMCAALMPLSTWAAAPAMVYSNGNFLLNGVAGLHSGAVMAGDRIQTGESGAVSLTRTGNSVLIGANSAVVYEGTDIKVGSGTAAVTTSDGLQAQIKTIHVAPARPAGSYRVTRSAGQISIAAVKGNLLLTDGVDSRTIEEGSTAYIPDADAQNGGALPSATRVSGGWNKKVGIAVAAGAVAATAIIVATRVDKPCGNATGVTVSPVCP